ncbi:unnamed protein product, partial [Cyprideis torosa]
LKSPVILSIESSCDDTCAAIFHEGKIKSNIIHTQLSHTNYGGVVPELASREHLAHILPVVKESLVQAEITLNQVDAIAVTQGPGLLGSLLVGVCFAKSLSASLGIPCIGVHHMQAHILSLFAEDPKPTFPFLCLTEKHGMMPWVKHSTKQPKCSVSPIPADH